MTRSTQILPVFALVALLAASVLAEPAVPNAVRMRQKQCKVYKATKQGFVVIEPEDTEAGRDWAVRRRRRARGGRGIVFRPANAAKGTKGAGRVGKRSFQFKVYKAGYYRLVLRTYVPSNRFHNDLWVRFPGVGALLHRKGAKPKKVKKFFKVYSKIPRVFSLQTLSQDKQPAIITTGLLKKNKVYTVQLSGRSNRVFVDSIFLYQCSGRECHDRSRKYYSAVNGKRPKSTCSSFSS